MEGSRDLKDTYNVTYLIHFLLGIGNLIPWNSFITAVDYFEYLYPNNHVDKVFSMAYMTSTLLILLLLMYCSTLNKLPNFRKRTNCGQVLFILALMTPPVTDWIAHGNVLQGKQHIASYAVLVAALVACGFADGLIAGSLIGTTAMLPGRYMQAVFAGSGSSGIFVSILRIVTKAALPRTPKGLRMSTQIYFIISTLIILVCTICYNLLHKLPIIQHYSKQRTITPKTPIPSVPHQTQQVSIASELQNSVEPSAKRPKFWEMIKKIRCAALGILVIYIVTLSIFPGYLSENVESEFFHDWYPILLITTFNAGDFVGKCLSAIYVPKSSGRATWGCMARILFYPLFTACIHGPKWLRSEFPVVFLTGILGISNGYLTTVLMILAPKAVPVEESETVGIVMILFLVIGLAAGSVVGWLWNI